MEAERSTGALVASLLAIALLGASLGNAWFTYASTTGRRTPASGLHDPNDTQAIHHDAAFAPFGITGDTTPTDPATADTAVLAIGLLVAGAILLLLVQALGELPVLARFLPRRASLALLAVVFLALVAAGTLAWTVLPGTMASQGVTGPFTSVKLEDGYIFTTLGAGFVLAAIAAPLPIAAFAFKFQAGSADPALVEQLARKARTEGA